MGDICNAINNKENVITDLYLSKIRLDLVFSNYWLQLIFLVCDKFSVFLKSEIKY